MITYYYYWARVDFSSFPFFNPVVFNDEDIIKAPELWLKQQFITVNNTLVGEMGQYVKGRMQGYRFKHGAATQKGSNYYCHVIYTSKSWLRLLQHKPSRLCMPAAPCKTHKQDHAYRDRGGSCKSRASGTWSSTSRLWTLLLPGSSWECKGLWFET